MDYIQCLFFHYFLFFTAFLVKNNDTKSEGKYLTITVSQNFNLVFYNIITCLKIIRPLHFRVFSDIKCLWFVTTSLPVFPWGQRQTKDATRSMHVEPGLQAAVAQSSMFSEQSGPLQPLTHTHT